jgi:hypothetical protein
MSSKSEEFTENDTLYKDFDNDEDFAMKLETYLKNNGIVIKDLKELHLCRSKHYYLSKWDFSIPRPEPKDLIDLDVNASKDKIMDKECCCQVVYNTVKKCMGYYDKDGIFVAI